jgi:hypothetical protein
VFFLRPGLLPRSSLSAMGHGRCVGARYIPDYLQAGVLTIPLTTVDPVIATGLGSTEKNHAEVNAVES